MTNRMVEPSPADLVVARRRVESSVCAFGGNLSRDRVPMSSGTAAKGQDHQQAATVTPSSLDGSSETSRFVSHSKMKYDEALASRYYENESRLSWEFEETPPVEDCHDEDDKNRELEHDPHSKATSDKGEQQGPHSEDNVYGSSVISGDNPDHDSADANDDDASSPHPKMRYRCKLCGQPKQNHNCPYQQSLARSIGVNVYPAVNAFAADEPGFIAPPLSEMNNFTDLKDLPASSDASAGGDNRPTPERVPRGVMSSSPSVTQVTPETMRSGRGATSSASVSGAPSTPSRTPRKRNGSSLSTGGHVGKKRSHSQYNGADGQPSDLLFMDTMDLLPEQFRPVTQRRSSKSFDTAYVYPTLPLPYAQRKRLSDNLFALSNEVPKLTVECAAVLREAREKDMWDLAVAELMTQVIVINHCPENDFRFDGLRQYLLTLGIAC
jgi:hypothetical protein